MSKTLALSATFALATLVASVGVTAPARAEMPADGVANFEAAFAKFDAVAEKTKAEGRMPQLDKPDEKAALDAIWDEPALLGKPPYTKRDLPALFKLSAREAPLPTQYLFFGGQAKAEENFAKYQDEITRAEAFSVQMSAATLAALTDFVATLPPSQMNDTRRAGLKQMRFGMSQIVEGFTTELRSPVKPANKAIMVHVLARTAPAFAAASTPDVRQTYSAQAEAALPSIAPALKPELQAFIDAMATTECTGLCALR